MKTVDGEEIRYCPKCNATSGDDWSQCEGKCPLSISPHYDKSLTSETDYTKILVANPTEGNAFSVSSLFENVDVEYKAWKDTLTTDQIEFESETQAKNRLDRLDRHFYEVDSDVFLTETDENLTIIARSIGRTMGEVNHIQRAKDIIRSLNERDLTLPLSTKT